MSSNQLVAKLFFLSKINYLLAELIKRPLILAFHQIKEPTDSLLDRKVGVTDPKIFKMLLIYLSHLGYSFVSLNDLVAILGKSKLARVAAVTFDDGYRDLYQEAYPILKKLNIPFTLFLTTAAVNSDKLIWMHKLYISLNKISHEKRKKLLSQYITVNSKEKLIGLFIQKLFSLSDVDLLHKIVRKVAEESGINADDESLLANALYLSEEHILDMSSNGLSVETHGHKHIPLSILDREEKISEILTSMNFIENKFHRRPRFFAFPFGNADGSSETLIKSLGLDAIFLIKRRLCGFESNLFSLPRLSARYDMNLIEFSNQLTRMYLRVFI
jgi:peptidoglycan/xylan/chitin deacetylase (PgdA/CDA1 family)